MPIHKIVAIILIFVGVLGLVYGGFSFTSETHEGELGPLSFSVDEREYVSIPTWAGLGAIIAGVGLLLLRRSPL